MSELRRWEKTQAAPFICKVLGQRFPFGVIQRPIQLKGDLFPPFRSHEDEAALQLHRPGTSAERDSLHKPIDQSFARIAVDGERQVIPPTFGIDVEPA
jgi:hypothetical protein